MSTSLSPRSSAASAHPTRQQLDELDALLQRMLDLPVNRGEEEPEPAPVPTAAPPVKEPRPSRPPVSYSDETADVPVAARERATPSLEPRVIPASPAPVEEAPAAGETPDATESAAAAENWVPFRSSWEPSSLTWQPLQENWKQVQAALRHRHQEDAVNQPPSAPTPEPSHPPETAPPDWTSPAPAAPPANAEDDWAPTIPLMPTPQAPPGEQVAPTPTPAAGGFAPVAWWQTPLLAFNLLFDLLLWPLGPLGKWLRRRPGRNFLGFLGLLALAGAAGLALADWFGWTW
jgi:hypothetical protein